MPHATKSFPPRRLARRVRNLGPRQWLLLAETLILLATASAAIAVLPFRRVVQLASRDRPASHPRWAGSAGMEEVRWAVEAAARRVPWRTVCFQKGLALHLMLRRRGLPSQLHYGVGMGEEGKLAAHVWISLYGQTVLGGDVADRFQCLAIYPDQG